jgi:hypothetical protein
MPSYHDAWLRHQQSRWLRPDGDRWIRPDAARFLAPGADITKAFPVLARKYSPEQPRVPSGNPDGGQWTDGAATGGISSGRLGRDASIAEEVGSLVCFRLRHGTTRPAAFSLREIRHRTPIWAIQAMNRRRFRRNDPGRVRSERHSSVRPLVGWRGIRVLPARFIPAR